MMETPFAHSREAINLYPAPHRDYYHTGAEYAAACERIHCKRLSWDKRMAAKFPARSQLLNNPDNASLLEYN